MDAQMFDQIDKFAVQYTAGTCGTLLTWFINQHMGFPEISAHETKEYDLALNTVGCHWTLSANHSDGRIFQTVEDVIANIHQDQLVNNTTVKNIPKICFKTFPHDIVNDITDHAEMESAVETLVAAGVTRWVYPIISRDTYYIHEAIKVMNRKYIVQAARYPNVAIDHNSAFNSMYMTTKRHLPEQNSRMKEVLEKYNIQPLFLDMAALLGGDYQTYSKLLNHIQVMPLDNWNQVLHTNVKFWELPYA
jgi:hypothetical protein